MKKLFILLAIVGFMFVTITNDEAYAAAKSKMYKGKVVSLNSIVSGGNGIVTKDEAIKLVENGHPIVFMEGTGKKAKIHFVYMPDGSFAGKTLSKYANYELIGITGKIKKVNGLSILILEGDINTIK